MFHITAMKTVEAGVVRRLLLMHFGFDKPDDVRNGI
jgi:hypothetical protein